MNRKLKKLIKNPRLYFVDMFKKKMAKGKLPSFFSPMLKVRGTHKFSIVSAVYGVEKYLEQYLSSLENQTLNFADHIELIMVDDGSPDGSADIIKKWVEKYPDNIKYVKKENGGQASARNLGMEYVSHDWVTFIDPDDFVDVNYFAEVDKFLFNKKNVALVSCNFIFYFEDLNQFSDKHPLQYRFKNKELILNKENMDKHVQLSVNSAFFRTEIIVDQKLIMEPAIRPAFEDAHFVGKYLLSLTDQSVAFIRDAKYYYRKRQDASSTLDTSWESRKQYVDKIEYGLLDLCKFAVEKEGTVPHFIQRMVLYDVMWTLRYLINHKENISFLSDEDKSHFKKLLWEVFEYIDLDVINRFELAGCWFFHKVGMAGMFKNENLALKIIYIDDYDESKGLLKLRYFYSGELPLEKFTVEGEDITPMYAKTRSFDFLDKIFVNERIIFLPIKNPNIKLFPQLNRSKTCLYYGGKQHFNGLILNGVCNSFVNKKLSIDKIPLQHQFLRKIAGVNLFTRSFENAWVFLDRDTQADDNAEHLYRYISSKYPETNCYFVLRTNSNDWKRLNDEGFRLIPFGSVSHKLALIKAKHLISSHVDQYVVDLLPQKYFSDLLSYRFTFLQHGVIQNDLSNWLNNKKIDLFTTTTNQEFISIAGDENRYKFTLKEVSLLGLPRHDGLLELSKKITPENLIVIMPTWRQSLVGDLVGVGNSRKLNDEFYASTYALSWKNLLHSPALKKMIDESDLKVLFFPHSNISPYLEWFDTPDYISTVSREDVDSMQSIFCRAKVLLTDYSSVAFEMAYLNKAIIYYQFDYDYVFGGGHTTSEGYFDYQRDGFGGVCYEYDELVSELGNVINNDCLPTQKYLDRMDKTFAYRDGKCSERTYEAIRHLEDDSLVDNQQLALQLDYAEKARDKKEWLIASQRWEDIYLNTELSEDKTKEVSLLLVRSYRLAAKLGRAEKWLNEISEHWSKSKDRKELHLECAKLLIAHYTFEMTLKYWNQAKILMCKGNWGEALATWDMVALDHSKDLYIELQLYKVECLAYLKHYNKIKVVIDEIEKNHLSEEDGLLIDGWKCVAEGDFDSAIKTWESSISKDSSHYCNALSYINYQVGDINEAMHYSDKGKGIGLIPMFDENNRFIPKIDEIDNGLDLDVSKMSAIEIDNFIKSLEYYNYKKAAEKFSKLVI